jgi:hypothetical protein
MGPSLAKVVVVVKGESHSSREVIATCTERAESTGKLLEHVKGLIRFEEGPKKAFETGKTLLARSKKSDAASQFGECISEGLIIQNQHPELKETAFDVAGGQFTLGALVQECIKQKKAIEP